MENIKFIGAQNEIQKIYSDLGLIVPVGDLDNGKAPAIQPLPATSTTTSITAKFNVMSGGDISSLSYKVNDGEATSITPAKGVVTITLSDLEYNSGPYEIELTATNETGSTVTSSTVALQHYTNWATPDEVLEGNKFIGEDGQEAVGTYIPSEGPGTGGATITSCVLEEDPNMGIYMLNATFDSLPSDIITDGCDNYKPLLFLNCFQSEYGGYLCEGDESNAKLMTLLETIPEIDTSNNTITDEACLPKDENYNVINEAEGYLVLYKNSFTNPIYKWPCTVTVNQNNA